MQGERQARGRRKECQGRPSSPQSGDSKKKKEKFLRMETWPCPSLIIIKQDNPGKKIKSKSATDRFCFPKELCVKNRPWSKSSATRVTSSPLISFIKSWTGCHGSSVTVTGCTHPRNLKSEWHIDETRVLPAVRKRFPLNQLTQALMHSDPAILKLHYENEVTGNLIKMKIMIL